MVSSFSYLLPFLQAPVIGFIFQRFFSALLHLLRDVSFLFSSGFSVEYPWGIGCDFRFLYHEVGVF
jgi:hypothetical protein